MDSAIETEIPTDSALQTPRCVLRALREGDAPFIAAEIGAGGFTKTMRWDLPLEENALGAALRMRCAQQHNGTGYGFTIEERATRTPVGGIALRREPRAGDWSMGFWIASAHWGRGFAAEAARVVLDFAFSELQARTVRAAHAQANAQSRRVIEKLGMRFVREIADSCVHDGDAMPELEYAIERG